MAEKERFCPFIVNADVDSPRSATELQQVFLKGKIEEKCEALKELIQQIICDETFPRLMMPVLQSLVPIEDHEIKKLLMLYYEVVDKVKPDGNIRDEILLSCNNFRKDLLHANEYIRGKALKLISRMTYRPLIEPLMQAITENLKHRHYYVRRNAVSCLMSIFLNEGAEALGDAPEILEELLVIETDLSTKRNAFLLLFHCSQERAFEYLQSLLSNEDPLSEIGDLLQLVIVELVRKTCLTDPTEKSRLMGIIYQFAESKSSAVLLECAHSLVTLSKASSAVRLAIQCYMKLLSFQNENNIILAILSKFEDLLKAKRKGDLEEYYLDILSIMSNSSKAIRSKVGNILLQLTNLQNISHFVEFIQKNLRKDKNNEDLASQWVDIIFKLIPINPEYVLKNLVVPLIDSYLTCEFPQAEEDEDGKKKESQPVVPIDVVQISRKALVQLPDMQETIIERLIDALPEIKSNSVFYSLLWVIGEYSREKDLVVKGLECLKSMVGPLPIVPIVKGNVSKEEVKKEEPVKTKKKTKTIVLPDGTYATQVIEETEVKKIVEQKKPKEISSSLRNFLLANDSFLATILGVAMAKLCLRLRSEPKLFNEWTVGTLLIICNLMKIPNKNYAISSDNKARLYSVIKVLTSGTALDQNLFLNAGEDLSKGIIKSLKSEEEKYMKSQQEIERTQLKKKPEEVISFRQLKGIHSSIDYELEDSEVNTLPLEEFEELNLEPGKVTLHQLTGYSDPMYVEAALENHYHTLSLTLYIINRTKKTLQNLAIEMFIKDDVKLSEKPSAFNLPPQQIKTLKLTFKASRTLEGSIFGYVNYTSASGNVPHVVPFNDIKLNFLDSIVPEEISERVFKSLWAVLIWENKINLSVANKTPYEFVQHLSKKLSLAIVSPLTEFDKKAVFLSANLFGRTKFGEELMLNLSIEQSSDSKIMIGFKIRSISRELALALGEKICSKVD